MEKILSLRQKIYLIIFETETKAGKVFDVGLIIAVFLSILAVMLETVESLRTLYAFELSVIEWFFTILFTVELMLRLYSTNQRLSYLFSFYGFVDMISILPTYIALFYSGAQSFLIIRSLRMLRIFRILKLKNYTTAGQKLSDALIASFPKFVVFVGFILTFVLIIGAAMYIVEGKESGFTSIPRSVYWAIVTMTTVGYGDIAPQTPLGQFLSSVLMIVGYGTIAVPTGVVCAELNKQKEIPHYCPHCHKEL